ncbi:unnamed protein product [Ectocarpus sp. CCAP 1310/34]|nr:unnamed protein product [Ectocarpus sp. CCAP 1310/34]
MRVAHAYRATAAVVAMAIQTRTTAARRSPRLAAEVRRRHGSSGAFNAGPCPPREPLGVSNRRAIATSARSKSSSPLAAGAESSGADVRPKRRIRRVSKPKGVTASVQKKTKSTLGRTRENRKLAEGFDAVIGLDEAGRGPFAGPVVAAACMIPPDVNILGIQDSKKITQHSDRETLFKELTETPGVIWATSEVGSSRIDEINILEATKEAMTNCVLEVCSKSVEPSANKGMKTNWKKNASDKKPFVLVDGNFTPPGLGDAKVEAECVVGGDGLEYCIAAASIIAKVTRDRLMIEFGERWPVFGFERHKGYGTAAHRDAIREHGMVEIHRRSFLKNMESSGGKLAEYKE